MPKIPERLHEIADEFFLDLSGFVRKDGSIEWDEMFDFIRHWAGEARAERESDYYALDCEIDEIANETLETDHVH